MRRISRATLLGALAAAVTGGTAGAAAEGTSLALVSYSTPREAYNRIIPAFQATPAGKDVSFSQSYGASGDQARAVINGLPADVVGLSLEPDMTELVKEGIVSRGWNRGQHRGMVTDSVVVFVVRNGNPKKIKGWRDLVRPGIEVITPNPFTSGGARWNVMAAYGAQLKVGKKRSEAEAYLLRLFENVAVQDKSAREALNTFLGGKGDVLLTYENEAILARQKGQDVHYVIPRATILIENPVAVTTGKNQAAARSFLRFLYSPAAQRIFGQTGYRPVVMRVARQFRFPDRPAVFDIAYVGGWARVQKQFFDPKNGVMARIERKVGEATG